MINPIKYFKNSVRELKHVVWPNRRDTNKYFVSALMFIVIFSTYLFISGYTFSSLVKLLDQYI